MITRRSFVKAGLSAATITALGCSPRVNVPSYLKEYSKLYQTAPKQAALQWFSDAKFGLFMHYGLYSLLARGEWVMLREAIPVAEYAKLKDQFTAQNFDANYITDLAIDAGMKYINITSKHHDGFCLWNTKHNDFNSVNSPAKRDLIEELATACDKKGLGFFLYYSYAADWSHPYFYPREAGWDNARPNYKTPQPEYLWKENKDFEKYIDYVHLQLIELLTQYGPIAGIWFDPIMGFYNRPDLFPIEKTYELVRSLQPHTLISFKQGANGTEDFAAPERHGHGFAERFKDRPELAKIAAHAWDNNKDKHNEICDTMQPRVWGYKKDDDGNHVTVEQVLEKLEHAKQQKCNLLLNTGPLPDGSIDETDAHTLKMVGQQLKA